MAEVLLYNRKDNFIDLKRLQASVSMEELDKLDKALRSLLKFRNDIVLRKFELKNLRYNE